MKEKKISFAFERRIALLVEIHLLNYVDNFLTPYPMVIHGVGLRFRTQNQLKVITVPKNGEFEKFLRAGF